jgi:branched-chain amino acid transport system permease protein
MAIASPTPSVLSAKAAPGLANSRRQWAAGAVLFCILAGLPFVASGYHLFQFSQVLIYAIALIGLNLLTGYNGQISLGHGAFFAVGGYTTAILVTRFGMPYGATLPVAGLFCFVAGFLFGLPALRLGGLYLALATFALAVATPQLLNFNGFDAWTGGSQGLQLGKPHAPFALPLSPDQWLYFLCLACAALAYWIAANLVRGRIGRAIVAIRDHPIAAETMGVNISFYKATCFGVSALYAGVAGALAAIVVGFVSPDSFDLSLSLSFLVGIVVGGLASIRGVLFGALFIEFVPNYADQLSSLFGESAKALPGAIYGLLLIALMIVMPTGVAGALWNAWRLLTRLSSRPKRV